MTTARASDNKPQAAGEVMRRTTWLIHPTAWWIILFTVTANMATALRAHLAETKKDENGNVITDNLAWIVFGVIAIVAIGALIKALGATVIDWVGKQLGIG